MKRSSRAPRPPAKSAIENVPLGDGRVRMVCRLRGVSLGTATSAAIAKGTAEFLASAAARAAAAALCLVLLVGCAAPGGRPHIDPVVIVLPSKAEAAREAYWWALGIPNRACGPVGHTGSMRPLLQGGEFLELERYEGRPLRAGEIIVLDRGDAPNVLHRIVCSSRYGVFTMGDNCAHGDCWRPLTAVKYTVHAIVRWKQ